MNVCVFCSAQDVPEEYVSAAERFGTLLGLGGHTLVWGGSDRGLMKAVAANVRAAGGKLSAVSVEFLKHKIHKSPDEVVIAKDLGERKALMLERSDAIVALPGGIGTLDELTDVIALKRHGHHDKLILVLNIGGFYDGLHAQFDMMQEKGFFANLDGDNLEGFDGLAAFVNTPEDAMRYIEGNGN